MSSGGFTPAGILETSIPSHLNSAPARAPGDDAETGDARAVLQQVRIPRYTACLSSKNATTQTHRYMTARRVLLSLIPLAAALLLAACASPTPPAAPSAPLSEAVPWQQARIVSAGTRLQCVEYARKVSGIDLRGDAWTWWGQARDRYERGRMPEPGSVLVIGRKGNSAGHLAVVTRVVNDRVIVASHANWLNQGRIHEHTPIQEVSARGDWSAVRVWYTPGGTWGRSTYPAHGFIHPRPHIVAQAATPPGP
jgi:hypothetical protein